MTDFDPSARRLSSSNGSAGPEHSPDPEAAPSATPLDSSSSFVVQFWGVRGSIPTPGSTTIRYGGNTSCVEMRVAGKRLIFDGGTGLRVLGQDLLQQELLEAHLFFTHSQWDRIQGFPFFYPAFVKGNCFHVYGATAQNGASIKQRLTDQMLRPNFEVPIHTMQSDLKFHDLVPGDTIALEDVTIETGPLNQPNRAIGYRVTWQGHCAVYATDTEPSVHRLDPNLLYLARQADLLIYDATYDELSPSSSKSLAIAGGHSTWQSGIEVAKAAGVKQVIMFHHDPAHNDDFLDQVEAQVQAAFPAGLLAREGMQLQIA